MGIKLHLVHDLLDKLKINLTYCPTDSMGADPLTKPSDRVKQDKYAVVVGLLDRSC